MVVHLAAVAGDEVAIECRQADGAQGDPVVLCNSRAVEASNFPGLTSSEIVFWIVYVFASFPRPHPRPPAKDILPVALYGHSCLADRMQHKSTIVI